MRQNVKNTLQIHKSKLIDFYSVNSDSELELPIAEQGISAGFPSPAADFLDASIDLNKVLIKNPHSTFYGKVKGDSMNGLGIDDGDLLVIDKSLEAQNGKIAVCYIDGEFLMKKIQIEKNRVLLIPANNKYEIIEVTKENDFIIWGIVVHVIKSF